ncbi:regulated by circadian rhythms/phosphatidylinositol transfer protein [Cryphonectria parasitica EP155]|uniref:Regulated by circadian rhythms/phosphatidylinositol transfer protein n=1 Tax=Cryphonectria parasitica (strain ATCC 38755 / EP155) TaxID=660469 RepID=A0A9P4XT60_CRYP1|nr:regulated by circadian rhythms/phosphatidylinositol transfer protein [Cryphonectria parasitica EP155]KAF3760317.1 regulated by circadian rhythms/phosphatidylinositol transfer protein [Cryphonectria parasitica EP155]
MAADATATKPAMLKVPLEHPTEASRPKPAPELTEEQQHKYDWLLNQVKSWHTPDAGVNIPKNAPSDLTEDEKFWLTRECLLRYLRATKWNQAHSEKRLIDTLLWRREFGVYDKLTSEHISPENETGKQVILGFDNEGRPCQYLNPGRQNTAASHRQVEHLVFMLERTIELMPPGQETLALLINFKSGSGRSGNTSPPISQAKEVLHILQTHYPERLGKALIINMPFLVVGFFKIIKPLLDPVTKEKLKFNEDMKTYVPAEQLWTEFSDGALDFEYDHAEYWPALIKMCDERRDEQKKRWAQGGSVIGESEVYLRGAEGAKGVQGAIGEASDLVQEKLAISDSDAEDKANTTAEVVAAA